MSEKLFTGRLTLNKNKNKKNHWDLGVEMRLLGVKTRCVENGNGSFRPRVVSALSRFGPGSIRPWVVSAQFGGLFRPIFSQLSGVLPKDN